MKQFISRILLFILPFAVLLILAVWWDPFRVFGSYDDYYFDNFIAGNREDICLKLFLKNENNQKINSFILGSSRSHAFKTDAWGKYLYSCKSVKDADIRCFHFDGSGFGLYRTRNVLNFFDRNGNQLKNLLLVVDPSFFNETGNPEGHLFSEPPMLSGGSSFEYYGQFLKATFDIPFLTYQFMFYVVREKGVDSFLGFKINRSKNFHQSNNKTADLYYGYDKDIANDSSAYYSNMISMGNFYLRDHSVSESPPQILHEQKKLLHEIKLILQKHKTNLRIVISPLYDQIAFNTGDYRYLEGLFGKGTVFNFSGKNEFTEPIGNFYEKSHYRPHVANEIMRRIYCEQE